MDPDGKRVHPIAAQGLDEKKVAIQTVGEGPIGEVCLTGLPYIGSEDEAFGSGSVDTPVAVIPLAIDDQTIGAIAVVEMLAQKRGWASVDKELFQLLAGQASTALVAATLFHAHGQSAPRALAALHHALRASDDAPVHAEP
jgi:GAF domain-containing protein